MSQAPGRLEPAGDSRPAAAAGDVRAAERIVLPDRHDDRAVPCERPRWRTSTGSFQRDREADGSDPAGRHGAVQRHRRSGRVPTAPCSRSTRPRSDNVDGPIATSCTPVSGSVFPIGATTVTCSATDAHHNTGTASFTVTVTDSGPAGRHGSCRTRSSKPRAPRARRSRSPRRRLTTSTAPSRSAASPRSARRSRSARPPCRAAATDGQGNQQQRVVHGYRPRHDRAGRSPCRRTRRSRRRAAAGAVFTFTATASDLVDGSDSRLVHAG